MAMNHSFKRIVVIENDEASGVTDDELREAALEKGLIQEGDIVVTPGDESYSNLSDRPSINGVTLEGNKTSSEYGLQNEIQFASNLDIDKLFK